jgi:N-methylhydantoinase B
MHVAPRGVQGGASGRAGAFAVIHADGTHEDLDPKQQHVALAAGDTFVLRTSGGGGLGPPRARDPEAVDEDRREGRVSVVTAPTPGAGGQ